MKKILILSLTAIIVLLPLFQVTESASSNQVIDSSNNPSYIPNIGDYTNITVGEAWNMTQSLDDGEQIPIDVRRDDEWIPEHISTPYPEYARHWPNLQNGEKLAEFMELYAGRQVIIYCRTGVRSFNAVKLLISNGFNGTIYNMVGGIVEWKNQLLPVKPNEAPDKPTIDGPNNGKVGVSYKYFFTTFDSDYDDIYYCIKWGDTSLEECVGPFSVMEEGFATHKWITKNRYTLQVKAKDRYDFDSEVATFEVNIPRNKIMPIFFLEKFQNIFAVLIRLLNN